MGSFHQSKLGPPVVGLAKNNFWLVVTQKKKKRIEEQLDYIWNMCPKLFSWGKK